MPRVQHASTCQVNGQLWFGYEILTREVPLPSRYLSRPAVHLLWAWPGRFSSTTFLSLFAFADSSPGRCHRSPEFFLDGRAMDVPTLWSLGG